MQKFVVIVYHTNTPIAAIEYSESCLSAILIDDVLDKYAKDYDFARKDLTGVIVPYIVLEWANK